MIFALDTNTISNLLRGEGNIEKNFQQEIIQNGNFYVIPPVVVYEIKRWLLDKPSKQIQDFSRQFDFLFKSVESEVEMPVSVWNKAAEVYISLKQKGQLINEFDILIAAYCLINGYTLATRNTKDFIRIAGLNLVNWFD